MVSKIIDNFNLEQICQSGQCFRMNKKKENVYSVIAGQRYLEVKQQEKECIFYCDPNEFESFWKGYFDLESNYASYMEKIDPKDFYLKNAAAFGFGIRILWQDLWEMIVSFLISQQNNITRIRRCIQNICEKYGDKMINKQGEIYYGFPYPKTLARLEEDDLKECNLGYRSKYVVRTAKLIDSGKFDLAAIKKLTYKEAKTELLKLFGVGEKVADCVCLFGLHYLQAFPMDTHIKQALKQHYNGVFPSEKYKGIEGLMQQYIFYYELNKDLIS